METLFQQPVRPGFPAYRLGYLIITAFFMLFSLHLDAGDAVSTSLVADSLSKDSSSMMGDSTQMASDTTNAKKGINLSSIEDVPEWVKYAIIGVGTFIVVAFAMLTSLRKSKPSSKQPPIGYRKHHHHHHGSGGKKI